MWTLHTGYIILHVQVCMFSLFVCMHHITLVFGASGQKEKYLHLGGKSHQQTSDWSKGNGTKARFAQTEHLQTAELPAKAIMRPRKDLTDDVLHPIDVHKKLFNFCVASSLQTKWSIDYIVAGVWRGDYSPAGALCLSSKRWVTSSEAAIKYSCHAHWRGHLKDRYVEREHSESLACFICRLLLCDSLTVESISTTLRTAAVLTACLFCLDISAKVEENKEELQFLIRDWTDKLLKDHYYNLTGGITQSG